MARPSEPPDLTALGFGDEIDEVLRGANPNPTRQGCPSTQRSGGAFAPRKADWRPRLRASARMLTVLRGSAGHAEGASVGVTQSC